MPDNPTPIPSLADPLPRLTSEGPREFALTIEEAAVVTRRRVVLVKATGKADARWRASHDSAIAAELAALLEDDSEPAGWEVQSRSGPKIRVVEVVPQA